MLALASIGQDWGVSVVWCQDQGWGGGRGKMQVDRQCTHCGKSNHISNKFKDKFSHLV